MESAAEPNANGPGSVQSPEKNPMAQIWKAEWRAHGLQEKTYRIALRATDMQGEAVEDSSLEFSDPAAGVTTPGTTDYPNAGMREIGVVSMNGYSYFTCGVIDLAADYAYFGTFTIPGVIVKVALNAGGTPTLVGAVALELGEDYPVSAVIDPAAGYAYFGLATTPGKVVKIALNGSGKPLRVGTLTFNAGEASARGGAIHAASGYAYFATSSSAPGNPATIVKILLNGSNPPLRSSSLTLNAGETSVQTGVIDLAGTYAYFGTFTGPGKVVKVALNGSAAPTRVGTLTLNATEGLLSASLIDPATGYLYFGGTDGSFSGPTWVIKVAPNGAGIPTRVGALDLAWSPSTITCSAIDPAGGYAYFANGPYFPASVAKVALNGTGLPTDAGQLSLLTSDLEAMVFQPTSGLLYATTYSDPTEIRKFNPSGVGPPVEAEVATLPTIEEFPTGGMVDPNTGYVYFAASSTPGIIVKFDPNGADSPVRTSSLILDPGENGPANGVMDTAAGFAYYSVLARDTNNNHLPGIILKVDLNGTGPPLRAGSLTLNAGELDPSPGAIDPVGKYAYFGTLTQPGKVVKVALNDLGNPTRVGAVTFNPGEDEVICAVIDPAAQYAYFGTYGSPNSIGTIVKVALNGTGAPTRVGSLVLNFVNESANTGFVDPVTGFLYFGTFTVGEEIIKVDPNGSGPPLQAEVISFPESDIRQLSFDASRRLVYSLAENQPPVVVKMALDGAGDLTRIGALSLSSALNVSAGGAFDLVSGYGYFGDYEYQNQPLISKVALSEKGCLKATKITLAEDAITTSVSFYSHVAAGNVRLAIYDNANPRNLRWESPAVQNLTSQDWITVPISSGTPTALNLSPGTYWLGWQVDTQEKVPSYTAGAASSEIYLNQLFGAAPAQLIPSRIISTDENWSIYLTYDVPNATRDWLVYH